MFLTIRNNNNNNIKNNTNNNNDDNHNSNYISVVPKSSGSRTHCRNKPESLSMISRTGKLKVPTKARDHADDLG